MDPQAMLHRIAAFFRYMADNKETRLYYVLPIDQRYPYAYQHSTIRDVGTICAILDLIKFDKLDTALFEQVIQNTLSDYAAFYQKGDLRTLNIGDVGFYLLALKKCQEIFPAFLPGHWEEVADLLSQKILQRQRPDGSFALFFDGSADDLSAEAFYLPEALIGLIALGKGSEAVKRSIAYQEANLSRQSVEDYATFYFNWQFQLLYHWSHHTKEHLEKLFAAIRHSRIASMPFGDHVATVEVACYMEGLAHGLAAQKLRDPWAEGEVERCLAFLDSLQKKTLADFHGGFVHSRFSGEARIDVAGHVVGGLLLLSQISKIS